MNLCSDEHDEVCYEGRYCPACSAVDQVEREKDREIDELKTRIGELESELAQLQSEE